jgi:hypothetical protein
MIWPVLVAASRTVKDESVKRRACKCCLDEAQRHQTSRLCEEEDALQAL